MNVCLIYSLKGMSAWLGNAEGFTQHQDEVHPGKPGRVPVSLHGRRPEPLRQPDSVHSWLGQSQAHATGAVSCNHQMLHSFIWKVGILPTSRVSWGIH